MPQGLDEDATSLAPAVRAAGVVPALVFVFAVSKAMGGPGAPTQLLWICHVAAPLLALGFALSNAVLVRLTFAPACAALPLGIASFVDDHVGVSIVAAVALPVVAMIGLEHVGVPRSIGRWTLATLMLMLAVFVASVAFDDGDGNVNLAHRAPAALGDLSGPRWWFVLALVVTVLVGGLHAATAHAFAEPVVAVQDPPVRAWTPASTTSPRSSVPPRPTSPALRVSRASEIDPAVRARDADAEKARSGPTTPTATPRPDDGANAAGKRNDVVRPHARTNAALSSAQLAAALAEVRRSPGSPPAPAPAAEAPGTGSPAPSTPIVPVVAIGGEAVVAGPAMPVPVVVGGALVAPASLSAAIDAPTDRNDHAAQHATVPHGPPPGGPRIDAATAAVDAGFDLDAPTVSVAAMPAQVHGVSGRGTGDDHDLDAPTVQTTLPPPGGVSAPATDDDSWQTLDAPTVAIPALTRSRKEPDGGG